MEKGESVKPVDIIIPTFIGLRQVCDVTQRPMLISAMDSLNSCSEFHPVRFIIVDNGDQGFKSDDERVTVVKMHSNMGWERGLIEGLKHSDSEFVVFANDDIFVPSFSRWWIREFVKIMQSDQKIAGVGPASNVVMGPQNIFIPPYEPRFDSSLLIGFCAMYRRYALDQVGGIDDTLPGGDDLDIGIRLRKAGWRLVVKKDTFIFHHGFVTGNAVVGTPDKEGGWNSPQMTQRTREALVKKHGVAALNEMDQMMTSLVMTGSYSPKTDSSASS